MIETTRLQMRELTEADAPALLALYRAPAIVRFMGPPPASLAEEVANIRTHRAQYYATRGYGLWGVVLRDTGSLVGRCGLLDATIDGQSEVELSYLVDPAWHGQGLATEATRAVLRFATDTLGLQRVVAVIQPSNVPSRRVAERVGMHYAGQTSYKTFGTVDLYVWQRI